MEPIVNLTNFTQSSQEDTFSATVTVENHTISDLTNWYLTCIYPEEITEVSNYTISRESPETCLWRLTPAERIIDLKSGDGVISKMKGKGSSMLPTNLKYHIPPKPKGDMLNIDFTTFKDIKDVSGFFYQYNWTKQAKTKVNDPNPAYFKLTQEGLEANLYHDDEPFKQNSKTLPRTEMRSFTNVYNDYDYVLEWTSKVSGGNAHYMAQVYGTEDANIRLLSTDEGYELRWHGNGVDEVSYIDVNKILNEFSVWRLEFNLKQEGYIRLYRDNVRLVERYGWTCRGVGGYIKLGMLALDNRERITTTYRNVRLTIV